MNFMILHDIIGEYAILEISITFESRILSTFNLFVLYKCYANPEINKKIIVIRMLNIYHASG